MALGIISICLEKKVCFQGCVIASELDDPSGHHDFPWMALHCNFQGLVAESNSDRDPGSGRLAKRPSAREGVLRCSPSALIKANFTSAAAAAHALNNAQNLLRVRLADALMIDAGCTDVTWSHAWNSVCGGSHRCFLPVCGRLVNDIQGMWDARLLQTPSGRLAALATATVVMALQTARVYTPGPSSQHRGRLSSWKFSASWSDF